MNPLAVGGNVRSVSNWNRQRLPLGANNLAQPHLDGGIAAISVGRLMPIQLVVVALICTDPTGIVSHFLSSFLSSVLPTLIGPK